MTRTEIINALIKKNGYESYLEIGVDQGINFNAIDIEMKVGVDPNPESKATIFMTSDDFFKSNEFTFDIIFIDGLHECAQVRKDILNSLDCLNINGIVVLHDMNPTTEIMQNVPRETSEWTGDGWKAFASFRHMEWYNEGNYYTCVVNTDYGCGIIKRGEPSECKYLPIHNYDDFDKNRKEYLNLISVEEFKERFLSQN